MRKIGINLQNKGELNKLAEKMDPNFRASEPDLAKKQPLGLKKIVEMYLGLSLNKGSVQCSNWEAEPLSEEQITCE